MLPLLSFFPWRLPPIFLSSVVWKASKLCSLRQAGVCGVSAIRHTIADITLNTRAVMCVSVMMDTVPFPCLWPPLAPPPRGLEPNILLERSREGVCVCVCVCVCDRKRAKSTDEALGSQNKGVRGFSSRNPEVRIPVWGMIRVVGAGSEVRFWNYRAGGVQAGGYICQKRREASYSRGELRKGKSQRLER